MKQMNPLPLLCAGVVLASCGSITEAVQAPDFVADVEVVYEGPLLANAITSILVVHPGAEQPADRTIVHFMDDAKIYRQVTTGDLEPSGIEEVAPGATVRIWTTGYELRSYPRQVISTRVEITDPV